MHRIISYNLITKLLIAFVLIALLFSTSAFSQQDNIQQIKEKAKTIYSKIDNIEIDTIRAVPTTVRGILANNVNLRDDQQVRNFLKISSGLFKIDTKTDDFKTLKILTDGIRNDAP